MRRDSPSDRLRDEITGVTAALVTVLVVVGLFAPVVPGWAWLTVAGVGYAVVVPLVALLYGDESDRRTWLWWRDEWWEEPEEPEMVPEEPTDDIEDRTFREDQSVEDAVGPNNRDALETLRERYARGELTDEQFERKLERLVETETLEDVERRYDRERGDDERDRAFEYE